MFDSISVIKTLFSSGFMCKGGPERLVVDKMFKGIRRETIWCCWNRDYSFRHRVRDCLFEFLSVISFGFSILFTGLA